MGVYLVFVLYLIGNIHTIAALVCFSSEDADDQSRLDSPDIAAAAVEGN